MEKSCPSRFGSEAAARSVEALGGEAVLPRVGSRLRRTIEGNRATEMARFFGWNRRWKLRKVNFFFKNRPNFDLSSRK